MRATVLLVTMLAGASLEAADPIEFTSSELRAKTFASEVQPLLRMYCADCHTGDEPEAELRLEFDAVPDLSQQFEQWTVILQRVGGHEMPPEESHQPSDAERDAFVNWVDAGLDEFNCEQRKVKPRTTVRRLNRVEYNNVVRDLFGVDIRPADDFPADDVGEGFDNIGEVLSLPPLLMEKYLDAAELVTRELANDDEAWHRIFPGVDTAGDEATHATVVREAVSAIASRAFRRPLDNGQLDRLMQLYQLARGHGAGPKPAVEFVTQAILVSPQFLFRLEEDPLANTTEPTPLDSYAIASRLSFFFWSTMPDETLNALAADGKLLDKDVVAEQALRMMQDRKADALVENFTGQWLQLRQLNSVTPDPEQFPSFGDALRDAMVMETSRYFQDLLVNDGSILQLIDSDYSFLDERLAKHYGVPNVVGDEFRKVRFDDDRRGGVLTHASILTLTSNPTRTSPVKRGKWILENILGTPPPPPPPNVPELEEGDELLGSLRERMQQHRENPSCAVCHRKMDALGFGFENFDAIGAWRDKDGRYEIDPAGELPGNLTFEKTAELRKILKANGREFASCLTRKLLTYALGRALSSRDQCVVDDIVEEVEQHDHRFSSLIVAIVTSDAFRFTGDTGAEP